MQERGVTVDVAPRDDTGQVSVDAIETMLDERVRLLAITHVPTNGGLVQPIEEIGRLARTNGSFYLVDACQSAGQMPLDIESI